MNSIDRYLMISENANAKEKDTTVLHSKVANYHHKQYPEFEEFGDATLVADNGR